MRASRDDERWTAVPLLDPDDGAAASRRHARGRTGRWVAAGAAVGAIALVLVAALALTDPARRRGVATSDAAPKPATRANAAHAATLGRTSSSDANDDGRAGHLTARRRSSRVVPGVGSGVGENEMVTLADLDDLDEETGEKSAAQRGWRKGDERWLKPSTIEANIHAADDELTNEFLDELPTRVPAHAIAEVKWAEFDETKDAVPPPVDVGSYAGEEIDWTVVREKKAAAAGAAEGAKQDERIRLIVESERLAAEQARWSDASYGSDAPRGSFILAPICLAVVSSVVVIAVLLVRNRGPYTRAVRAGGGDDGKEVADDGRIRGVQSSIVGETAGAGSKGGVEDRSELDAERGEVGLGSDANRRRSMDGAESSSVAESHSVADGVLPSSLYGATDRDGRRRSRYSSDAANLRAVMAGFGSRNTAMDRLIDDSRSDVAPSEAPSTVFEINPPRWVARMFGGGAARRDSGNLLSSATSGVEEAAAVAAREIAAGTSSRGESVFSVADFSDAEAYRPGHPHRANAPPPAAADGTGRVALHAGRAVATSAHASAFAAPPPPHLQSRSAGGGGGGGAAVAAAGAGAGGGKPPRAPFGAAMAGAGRPVPPDRPPRIVKSTTRFL